MPIRPDQRALYPDNWKEISNRLRFGRARYLCECRGQCGWDHRDDDHSAAQRGFLNKENAAPEVDRCPAVHAKPHPITGSKVVLTVAHLDHNPANCDEDNNLLAMCQRCHLRYDAELHVQTRRLSNATNQEALLHLPAQRGIQFE